MWISEDDSAGKAKLAPQNDALAQQAIIFKETKAGTYPKTKQHSKN